jgi:hypothetical protein
VSAKLAKITEQATEKERNKVFLPSFRTAVVLHCPFKIKISSIANAVYLFWPMQYICSKTSFSHFQRIAFTLPMNRLSSPIESPLLCEESAFHFLMARG